MTWGELKKKGNDEMIDSDVIDFLSITDKDNNELEFTYTSRGYYIDGYYKLVDYRHIFPSTGSIRF